MRLRQAAGPVRGHLLLRGHRCGLVWPLVRSPEGRQGQESTLTETPSTDPNLPPSSRGQPGADQDQGQLVRAQYVDAHELRPWIGGCFCRCPQAGQQRRSHLQSGELPPALTLALVMFAGSDPFADW
jgi:hypothetical protein